MPMPPRRQTPPCTDQVRRLYSRYNYQRMSSAQQNQWPLLPPLPLLLRPLRLPQPPPAWSTWRQLSCTISHCRIGVTMRRRSRACHSCGRKHRFGRRTTRCNAPSFDLRRHCITAICSCRWSGTPWNASSKSVSETTTRGTVPSNPRDRQYSSSASSPSLDRETKRSSVIDHSSMCFRSSPDMTLYNLSKDEEKNELFYYSHNHVNGNDGSHSCTNSQMSPTFSFCFFAFSPPSFFVSLFLCLSPPFIFGFLAFLFNISLLSLLSLLLLLSFHDNEQRSSRGWMIITLTPVFRWAN